MEKHTESYEYCKILIKIYLVLLKKGH